MSAEYQPQHWWEMLPAIPVRKDSRAYRRLQRVWFDHTWNNHPFMEQHHENHLTATPFENFIVLNSLNWPATLLETAGIRWRNDAVTQPANLEAGLPKVGIWGDLCLGFLIAHL